MSRARAIITRGRDGRRRSPGRGLAEDGVPRGQQRAARSSGRAGEGQPGDRGARATGRTSPPAPWPVSAPTPSGCWPGELRCYGPSRRLFTLEHAARRHGYTLAGHLAAGPLGRPAWPTGSRASLPRGVEGLVIEVPTHLVEVDVAAARRPAGGHQRRPDRRDRQPDRASMSTRPRVCRRADRRTCSSLGHETVWHIAGPRDWDAAEKRRVGWRSALEAAGRPVPPVLSATGRARSGYELGLHAGIARQRSRRSSPPTTTWRWACCGPSARPAAEIPGDVSVVGFDDVPEAEFQMVPLTTVAIDAEDAAERILSELVHMIEIGRPTTDSVDLEARLVLRRSTGRRPDGSYCTTNSTARPTLGRPPGPHHPLLLGRTAMSSSAFTRRKFLISTAAAASSAWLLAACGGGDDTGPGTTQASASQVPQADIDKALDTETTLTFWTWVPGHHERGQAVHHEVPEDQGQRGQRRPGRPALPEAADGDPVRAGRAGRRPDGVPVHPRPSPSARAACST